MFKLQPADQPIKWPVAINIPREGGRFVKATFTAHFLMLDQDAIDALQDQGDERFIAETLVGWESDLKDEAGEALAFSDDARDQLARIPYVKVAILRAYFEFIAGARRKN